MTIIFLGMLGLCVHRFIYYSFQIKEHILLDVGVYVCIVGFIYKNFLSKEVEESASRLRILDELYSLLLEKCIVVICCSILQIHYKFFI